MQRIPLACPSQWDVLVFCCRLTGKQMVFCWAGGRLWPSEQGDGVGPFLTEVPEFCSGPAGADRATWGDRSDGRLLGSQPHPSSPRRGPAEFIQLTDLLLFAAGGNAEHWFNSLCLAGAAQLLQVPGLREGDSGQGAGLGPGSGWAHGGRVQPVGAGSFPG